MTPLSIDASHVSENKTHFSQSKYQPSAVLEAQRALWRTLNVQGARQKTLAQNFLIIGEPFEDGGKIYSKIFNAELLRPYTEPSLTALSTTDEFANVRPRSGGLVWEHAGVDQKGVLEWYAGIGAEAKDGRVLFNLHYHEAWQALFHEPVHEAAPDGGIGTAPRWIYEGYCEVFAKRLAEAMGFSSYNVQAGPYGPYAKEVEKLIEFVSETYVARAYFTNDSWSYGLLAPLWYKALMQHDLSPDIKHYIPSDVTEIPSNILNDHLKPLTRRGARPEWYKRWVTIFGRSTQMPELATAAVANPGLGKLQPLQRPGVVPTPMPTGEHITTTLTLNRYVRPVWATDRR